MKKITVLLFCFLTISLTQAQKFSWGNEESLPNKKGTLKGNFIENKNGIYSILSKNENEQLFLNKYDNNLKFVKQLDLGENGGYTVKLGNSVYIFNSKFDKKNKQVSLYSKKLDEENFKIEMPQKLVSVNSKKLLNFLFYPVGFSRDKSKFLITGSNISDFKRKEDKVYVAVVDINMNKVWEKTITIKKDPNQLRILRQFQVNNNGDVFILDKRTNEAKSDKRGKKNYTYNLLSYTNNGTQVNSKSIDIGTNKFISYVSLGIDNQDNVICAGLYSAQKSFEIKGYFAVKLDSDGKTIKSTNAQAFSQSFLATINIRRGVSFGFYIFHLSKIYFKNDGSFTIIGEHVTQKTGETPRMTRTGSPTPYNTYNLKDLILINMDKDGKTKWVRKIAKNQVYKDVKLLRPEAIGFQAFVKDNDIHILYNDNVRNIDKPINTKIVDKTPFPSIGLKMNSILVSISPNGTTKKNVLFENQTIGVNTSPETCTKVDDNNIILYGKKGSKYKLGRLTF